PVRQGGRLPSHAKEKRLAEMIRRSVFELNGTQHGKSSELIVLNSSFEIEWKSQWPQGDSGGYFFANNNGSNSQSDRFVISSNKKIFGAGFNGTQQVIETAFSDQSIHTFRLVSVLGGDVTFYVDNTIAASAPALFPVNINSIGDQYDSATSVTKYAGIFYDLKVWTNGDRNTGDLILDIPFDERDTDYQRDVSKPVGAEIASGFTGFVSEPSSTIQTDEDGCLTATRVNTGPAAATLGLSGLQIGRSYKINVTRQDGISDTGFLSVGNPVTQEWRYYTGWWVANESNHNKAEFVFTAEEAVAKVYLFSGAEVGESTTYTNFSVCEWSGVILQTALPEDWMQIEKKRWWDYWREIGNESNILEIAQ
ncbi:MAG: hypothetical protein ACPGGD_10000, partial [Thalassolituus sp.]